MQWHLKQDRKEVVKEVEEEEERLTDRQTDWLCGRAVSLALVAIHPNSAVFRIRVLESTTLPWSAVLRRPCWRQQQHRLLWLD